MPTFNNAQELIDAIEGEYGEEAQEEATDFAEEIGLLDQWEAEDTADEDEEYSNALGQELGRVEHEIGRQLTEGEEVGMLNSVSTEKFGVEVPDFVQSFGQQLSEARDTDEGRLHLAAEAAQQAMNDQEQPATFNPPPPPPPVGDDDDEEEYE